MYFVSCSDTRDKMRVFSRFHRFADHEQIQLALQRMSVFLFHNILQLYQQQ